MNTIVIVGVIAWAQHVKHTLQQHGNMIPGMKTYRNFVFQQWLLGSFGALAFKL
jgi:hypothetical protein